MKTILRFTKKGIVNGTLSDLPKKELCWVDSHNPSENDIKDISKITNISFNDLSNALSHEERPKTLDLEAYSMISFRAPYSNNNSRIYTTPVVIFLSKNKNNIISLRTREIPNIENLKESVIKTKEMLHISTNFLLYRILDEILASYFKYLDIIEEKIDQIEDEVLEKPTKTTVENIFGTKKTLIFFNKALTANREVITSIQKEYVKNIDKKNIARFTSLYSDITQLIDTESSYREMMTGTLQIYLTGISYTLNQTIKTLTIIASFALVPTVITGIYGMNFTFMPEIHTALGKKYGYYFSLFLISLSLILMYIYFRKKEWI